MSMLHTTLLRLFNLISRNPRIYYLVSTHVTKVIEEIDPNASTDQIICNSALFFTAKKIVLGSEPRRNFGT